MSDFVFSAIQNKHDKKRRYVNIDNSFDFNVINDIYIYIINYFLKKKPATMVTSLHLLVAIKLTKTRTVNANFVKNLNSLISFSFEPRRSLLEYESVR